MTEQANVVNPTRSFWIIAIVSLLWNIIGVMNYVYSITISPEALAAMPEAERALYADIPIFVNICYAIAVFAGVIASCLLLMRKLLAVSFFLISLVAIVLQFGFGLFLTPMLAVQGVAALILPIIVIAAALYFLWYSRQCAAKAYLS